MRCNVDQDQHPHTDQWGHGHCGRGHCGRGHCGRCQWDRAHTPDTDMEMSLPSSNCVTACDLPVWPVLDDVTLPAIGIGPLIRHVTGNLGQVTSPTVTLPSFTSGKQILLCALSVDGNAEPKTEKKPLRARLVVIWQ